MERLCYPLDGDGGIAIFGSDDEAKGSTPEDLRGIGNVEILELDLPDGIGLLELVARIEKHRTQHEHHAGHHDDDRKGGAGDAACRGLDVGAAVGVAVAVACCVGNVRGIFAWHTVALDQEGRVR